MGAYLELIRTVFQPVDAEGKLRNRVVAFTATASQEGVSYIANTFARELATQTHKRVVVVDERALQEIAIADASQIANQCLETQIDNLLVLSATVPAGRGRNSLGPARLSSWNSNPEFRKACLKALRWNFDYVILDCPSLTTSAAATTIAPFVDGVAVVVEANRTRTRHIQRAQQVIEGAGGKFLGFILNQRRYPIPNWLYQRL